MNIEQTVRIDKPAADVWNIVAHDFAGISKSLGSVKHSYPLDDAPTPEGAPYAGRVCEFSTDPSGLQAREAITAFDEANREMKFEVVSVNAPAALPLKRNVVKVAVRELSETSSEVYWLSTPELKAHGYLMYPMLKMGSAKTSAACCAS